MSDWHRENPEGTEEEYLAATELAVGLAAGKIRCGACGARFRTRERPASRDALDQECPACGDYGGLRPDASRPPGSGYEKIPGWTGQTDPF